MLRYFSLISCFFIQLCIAGNYYRVKVLATYPHNTNSYTQGLVYKDGVLYESTGRYAKSKLLKVNIKSGRVLKSKTLTSQYFGEGLAKINNRLFQLTYREGRVFEYDLSSFKLIRAMTYPGEGWGLCYNGKHLIMSNGSNVLTFRDSTDFSVVKRFGVYYKKKPLNNINELECVDGTVYANIYESNFIYQIDQKTGKILKVIDASSLISKKEQKKADVLNGIAYNPEKKVFYLTGKLWPKLFVVKFQKSQKP